MEFVIVRGCLAAKGGTVEGAGSEYHPTGKSFIFGGTGLVDEKAPVLERREGGPHCRYAQSTL